MATLSLVKESELVVVGDANLGLHWPRIVSWIIPAIDRGSGRYTVADIYNAISQKSMVAFVLYQDGEATAVCVVEIITYPAKKAISIVIMVGQGREDWLHHLTQIEDFGRERDCQIIEAWARPGWERVLPDWTKTHVLLEKNL